ncbi:MAG TPA: NAD(P)H-quinone oxidoreductase [Pseudomonadales bacterium]|nr:NAD(P)H-quinone oxidoreductase [Pseudomonadales bacterium]
MKAILIDSAQRMQWRDTTTPQPAAGEVRIRVRATAVNRADLMQRIGLYPPPAGASEILGLECAGEVEAVGAQVERWKPGDAVVALLAGGGYAEQVVCPADHLLPLPKGLDFSEGAALPEVFATAWLNLFHEAALQPGERVLLHAGASGVGSAAIQLCRAFGNPCFVTLGSAAKLQQCLALGAEAGHLRQQGSFVPAVKAWAAQGVDVVLDPVGGGYLADNLKVMAVDGRLLLIGLMGGASSELNLGLLLVKRFRLIGSTLRSRSDAAKATLLRDMGERLWPLFEAGRLRPIIHARCPIGEVEAAFALVESNQTFGKVVLELPG